MTDDNSRIQNPVALLALVCLPVFIGSLDLTIISAVLPNVIVDLRIPLQTGANDAAWVVSGYLLAYTVSVALMGRLSDFIGRRRTYFVALVIFIFGSWLVAVAQFTPAAWMRRLFILIEGGRPDSGYMALYALIAGRVIQALGAGAMVPVAMALVGDLFPKGQRAVALGVVGGVDTAGWVLGHLYGGLMVQVVPWAVLFWLNIPITTAVLAFTWSRLSPIAQKHEEGGLTRPARVALFAALGVVNLLALIETLGVFVPAVGRFSRTLLNLGWLAALIAVIFLVGIALTFASAPNNRRLATRFDTGGALLLTLALVGLNVGLGGSSDLDTGRSFTALDVLPDNAIPILSVAAVAFAAFIVVEKRTEQPLFRLSNFTKRNVWAPSLVNLLVGFCLMVGLVSVPLFINTVVATDLDQAALLSGLVLGALTIPMALATVPGGLLVNRFGYTLPTTAGLLIAVVGFALGHTWLPEMSLWVMGAHMALAGVGLGLTVSPISTAIINAVQADERGIAAAVVLVMRLLGMTLGTSVMTNYGVVRSNALIAQAQQSGAELDFSAFAGITIGAATQVINEMLIIAAVMCAICVLPSLLIRPHDQGDSHD